MDNDFALSSPICENQGTLEKKVEGENLKNETPLERENQQETSGLKKNPRHFHPQPPHEALIIVHQKVSESEKQGSPPFSESEETENFAKGNGGG